MKNKIFIFSIIGLVIDQILKFFVSVYLTKLIIIPSFLSLVYTKNYGVAFSMLFGNRLLILLISAILIIFIFYLIRSDYKENKNNKTTEIAYGMLLGGVFGNLFDRIIRGYVVDYISLNIFGYMFPIFNLADILITVGVLVLIINIIFSKK